MITGRGITLLASAGLAWLAGRTLGIPELYVVSVAAAAVVGFGIAYVRLTTSAVSARRVLNVTRVLAGATVDVAIELRNDARVPSPTLKLREQLPSGMQAAGHPVVGEARFVLDGLGPGRLASLPYQLLASNRGRYSIGPSTVLLNDPFGVAERPRRFTSTADILVYPHVEHLPPLRARGSHMGAGSSDIRRVFASGDDFHTMREYVRGDDLRHVHWPSTAHRQKLMIRQMEQPWQAHATVYLDTRRGAHSAGASGTFERGVSIAASMVYHLAEADYSLRLITDVTVGRIGQESWEVAMDRLAVVAPSPSGALGPSLAATRGGEGLFVGVLGVWPGRDDVARHADLRALLGVRGFGQRMGLVVAPVGDPRGARMVALLRAAGWKAATIAPREPLAEIWESLNRRVSRHGAVAR